ncbi:MAG: phosphate ABC transporter substrate-binding protein [Acidobacteriota bacterium]
MALALMMAFIAGCSRQTRKRGLTVAGSTSVQPFADRWAEVYMLENRGRMVNVQGGGSSAGIQAARSGAADIGTSSRELRPEEKDLLEMIVAWDGLAVIVHPQNPIADLNLLQVRNIFAGYIRNWPEVGGAKNGINVVTREEGSGTRGAFQELVMGKTRIFKGAIVQDSNGTVREIVAHDPHSIGYISLGLVNEKVKAVSLEGIAPTYANIDAKQYRLIRPFLFVISGPPKPMAQEFINFVLSRKGQDLIKKEGLIPVFRE